MRESSNNRSQTQHDWEKKGVPLFVSVNLRNLFLRKKTTALRNEKDDEEEVSSTASGSSSSVSLADNPEDDIEDENITSLGRKTDKELLTSIELQIVVPRDKWIRFLTVSSRNAVSNNSNISIEQEDPVVLLSYTPSCPKVSFHPTWDHLDDLFFHSNPTIKCEDITFQQHLYPHLELHLYEQRDKHFLMSIPLHPKRLCPFFSSSRNSINSKDTGHKNSLHNQKYDGSENEDARATSTASSFSFTTKLPPSLPPNSLFITYTNQDICISTSLHTLMTEKKMLSTPATPYFEDDVFNLLSSSNPATSINDGLDSGSAATPNISITSSIKNVTPQNLNKSNTGYDDYLFDLLPPESPEKSMNVIKSVEISSLPSSNVNAKKKDFMISEIEEQCRELQLILECEEKELQSDEVILQSETEELKSLMKEVQTFSKERFAIEQEVTNHTENYKGNEFLLEARRMKLLRELQQIYPIAAMNGNPNNNSYSKRVYSARIPSSSSNTDMVYTIRGLTLPHNVHSTTLDDEEISAALGYVTHLVFMIGKYLDIPLRYTLVCHPSRSHVLSDIGFTYYGNMLPLYKDRDVDKAQLDRGITLLEKNIDCLLRMRGIINHDSEQQPQHMLAKLIQLFQQHN